jgi:hypothetical protein
MLLGRELTALGSSTSHVHTDTDEQKLDTQIFPCQHSAKELGEELRLSSATPSAHAPTGA